MYNSDEKLSRNHYGFQTAANDVLSGLSDYVQSHEIKGDLKIWAVGFSRGAAVANLLGRALNNATIGRDKAQRRGYIRLHICNSGRRIPRFGRNVF